MGLIKTPEEKIAKKQAEIADLKAMLDDGEMPEMKQVFRLLFSIYMRLPAKGWIGTALRVMIGAGIGIAFMTAGPEIIRLLGGFF